MKKLVSDRLKQHALIALAACIGFSASACSKPADGSSADTATSGSSSSEKPAEPTQISIMSIFYGTSPLNPESESLKQIEANTNTKLSFTWIGSSDYGDRVNLALSSGDIPDMMLVTDVFGANIRTAVKNGVFWEITPYMDQHEEFKTYPSVTWDSITQADGKIYGLPRVRGSLGQGDNFSIRKDWLDALDLAVPTTMDELYEAAKAFVFNDPDGNGKDDTIGIGLNEYSWINVFNLFNRTEVNNSTGKWVIQEDGSLLYYIFTEESRQALQWLQTAYKEGVLYKDFVSAKSQQVIDLMKGGSLGMYGEGLSNSWVVDETLRKIVPEAETLPIVSLAGPSGVQHTGEGTGVFGMFAVPKTVPQDKLEKIIDFFVYGATDEGYMLGNYGVEGLHYNLVDGEPVVTEQAAKDVVTGMNNIFAQYDKYYYAKAPNIPKDYLERNRSIIDAKEKVAVPSVSYGLYSPTFVEFGGDMEKNINDFIIKTIIGENSLEDWDGFVQEMTGNKSLTAITQEMNEAYQVRLK